MIEIDVKVTGNIVGDIEKIKADLKRIPGESLSEFKKLTPIDTGNARNRTSLQGDKIVANYPYAQRLDQGWSKQAPDGMSKPFASWWEKRIKKSFGK